MDYQGYKLIDKIMLVCKERATYESSCCPHADYYQAYLADPTNKKQLESAQRWAKWTEYGPNRRDEVTGKWVRDYEITHEPIEFEFDNNGFSLELLDCAGGSSQGGKLSFWNCLVAKDDKTFKIGINSDMLLDLLKNATFISGKCQSPLIFITQKGKVGMTTEGSDTYNQCIRDREFKNEVKAKATSKFSFGDIVSATTVEDIYLGTVTKYYDFDVGNNANRYSRDLDLRACTLTKLKNPITYHMFGNTGSYKVGPSGNYERYLFTKLSEVIEYYSSSECFSMYAYPDIKTKCPKRIISNKLELDRAQEDFSTAITSKIYNYSEFEDYVMKHYTNPDSKKALYYYLASTMFGFNTSQFDISEDLMRKIKQYGIRYVEE